MSTLDEKWDTLTQGKVVEIWGKVYALCDECGRLVRVNKPILGSLHVCNKPLEETK